MIRSAAFVVASMALATSLIAHHGAGTFDLSETVSFPNARLTRVELINPHSWLYFEVTEADGSVTPHRCEMRSAHVLRRSGWSQNLFRIGEEVELTASPDRLDPNSCYLQTILYADDSRMDRYGQYVRAPDGGIQEVRGPLVEPDTERALRRPSGEPDISGDWAAEQRVMVDPRGVGGGMVLLGQLAAADAGERPGRGGGGGRGAATGPRLYGGTELTALGAEAAERFPRESNPRFRCETTSIIFDWAFDGPVNRIIQNEDSIVLIYGQHGLERTIHMNMTEHPARIEPSRTGHSIGRWEDDVLVVDTVGFREGVLTMPVLHSGRLHVVERFSLDPETLELTRSYMAEDPLFLKGQYTGSDVIQPADVPYTEDVCNEQGFINYSEEVNP